MRPAETIAQLDGFSGRGAGTDAERRAAVALAAQLDRGAPPSGGGHTARTEPFWCRPNWALAHAWHAALGVVGSLLTRASPAVGGALLLAALVSVVADAVTGVSFGRLLTRESASQNVVSEEPPGKGPVHLVITANYDAGRCGLAYRDPLRRPIAWLARAAGRRGPGWLGWLFLALAWLFVVAVLRAEGSSGPTLDVVQFVPTVGLLLGFALLFEMGTSGFSAAAGDNGSGVAAAIALVRALDAAPPRHMTVDLVLQGAGDGEGIGMRHYLRSRREVREARNTVVLGLAACGAGSVRWYVCDGAFVPRGYLRELRSMCAAIAHDEVDLASGPHRGRGHTPALNARWARLPAISLGCLDSLGLAPYSHQPGDTPTAVDTGAIDRVVEYALLLVDRIDASLVSGHVTTPA